MKKFELEYQGLIDGDKVNDTDYLLGSTNPITFKNNTNKKDYEYDQGVLRRTRNACVLYANAAALGYTMGYEFSVKELLEIVDLAEKKYYWKEDKGMYISSGVDCVRNWWNNKYPDRKVKTFRMEIGDDDFRKALAYNYRLVVGYRTCSAYYKDSQDNGVIDNLDFGNYIGGHCVSTKLKNNHIYIVDNYKGKKKYNEYINDKIHQLKIRRTYFPSAYIYVKDTDIEDEIEKNIDIPKAVKSFKNGFWNGLNPRQNVTRQECATMIQSLYDKIKTGE